MNAAGTAVIQADPDFGAGIGALPGQVDRQRDALHADPVQGLFDGQVVCAAMSGKVSAFIRNLPLGFGFKCYVITSELQNQRILTMIDMRPC